MDVLVHLPAGLTAGVLKQKRHELVTSHFFALWLQVPEPPPGAGFEERKIGPTYSDLGLPWERLSVHWALALLPRLEPRFLSIFLYNTLDYLARARASPFSLNLLHCQLTRGVLFALR